MQGLMTSLTSFQIKYVLDCDGADQLLGLKNIFDFALFRKKHKENKNFS